VGFLLHPQHRESWQTSHVVLIQYNILLRAHASSGSSGSTALLKQGIFFPLSFPEWLTGHLTSYVQLQNHSPPRQDGPFNCNSIVTYSHGASQADPVRLQILTLAAKLFVVSPSTTVIQLVARYVFAQARFDVNYDVQDRGRMLCALLRGVPGAQDLDGAGEAEAGVDEDAWERRTKEKEANIGGVILRAEQARAILFEGKGVVDDGEEVVPPGLETLGTIGIVMGKTIYGDFARRFFDWSEGTDPLLRDSPADVPAQAPQLPQAFGSGGTARVASAAPVVLTPTTTTTTTTTTSVPGNGKNWRDLDAFYASEESDEGDSGGEDDEEEEEEGNGESSSEDEG